MGTKKIDEVESSLLGLLDGEWTSIEICCEDPQDLYSHIASDIDELKGNNSELVKNDGWKDWEDFEKAFRSGLYWELTWDPWSPVGTCGTYGSSFETAALCAGLNPALSEAFKELGVSLLAIRRANNNADLRLCYNDQHSCYKTVAQEFAGFKGIWASEEDKARAFAEDRVWTVNGTIAAATLSAAVQAALSHAASKPTN